MYGRDARIIWLRRARRHTVPDLGFNRRTLLGTRGRAQLVIGALVALLPGNLVSLVISPQVLNGFITPLLLCYILILANRRSVLGDVANGPIFRAVATVCVAVVGALSAIVLAQTVAGWL